jgi:hypothetical protein
MFSFFPCAPFEPGWRGFSRPPIRLRTGITDNLFQGKKTNLLASVDEARELWELIVEQVQDQGLALGVYAELPPIKG